MSDNAIEVVHSGRFIEFCQRGKWEFVRRRKNMAAVGIVAMTTEGELLLVQQYRPPIGCDAIEIPAGLIGDDEANESIESAARRELLEETGYEAEGWRYLFGGPSSAGMADEQVHLVLAKDLRQVHAGGGVSGEKITIHRVRLDQLDGFLKAKQAEGVQVDLKVRLAECFLKAALP